MPTPPVAAPRPGVPESPQTDRPLRVGVVGLGAGTAHIRGYARLPGVQLVAIAGLERERLRALGEEFAVPRLLERWEDLVALPDLDAVSVATPTFLHAPVSIAALESGKHVLSEKPLARDTAEGQRIVDAARAAGRVLQVVFNHRRRGDVQVLKRFVDDGVLGDIYHAKAFWLRRVGIPGLGSWFTSKQMAGGGPLIDLGVHVLDMALFLLGEPEVRAVSAATYAELGTRGRGFRGDRRAHVTAAYEVEDLATALLRLDGGATLALETSWASHRESGDAFGVTLYGTEGGAELLSKDYAVENTLRIFTDVGGQPVDISPEVARGEGHFTVVRDFVAAIRSGAWAAHDGTEGLARTRIIDACYRSAAAGHEVPLDETVGVSAVA